MYFYILPKRIMGQRLAPGNQITEPAWRICHAPAFTSE
jgi:hypothetical protein